MTQDLEALLQLTRAHFPHLAATPIRVEPLEKGGSDRRFLRLQPDGHPSLIFVQYGRLRAENAHYVQIARFLELHGLRVPRMFHHDPDAGHIWMEDLGNADLWSFRHEPWSVRRPLYEAVLEQALKLHRLAHHLDPADLEPLNLQPPFDETLYLWEQNYFLQHCLSRHFGLPDSALLPAREPLTALASQLAALPRSLVHRDFQSQNLLLLHQTPCLIDFQGLRFGLPQYDLASLLLDPYVSLSEPEQNALLAFYQQRATESGTPPDPAFHPTYWRCAAQRLMQALGAYGFLGHEKGRADFLAHIPAAFPRLLHVLTHLPELAPLHTLLAPLNPCQPRTNPAPPVVDSVRPA